VTATKHAKTNNKMQNILTIIIPVISGHSSGYHRPMTIEGVKTLIGMFIVLNLISVILVVRSRIKWNEWINFDSLGEFIFQVVMIALWAIIILGFLGQFIGKLL